MNCLFCNLISGKISTDILYQDEDVIAFKDINPQAPVHCLIIPKTHITTLNDLEATDAMRIGKLIFAASQLAKKLNVAEKGYRVVMNCNQEGGQSVYHIHLHLLAGRQMIWPPG